MSSTIGALPQPGSNDHDALVARASERDGGRRVAFDALVRIHWSETWRLCAAIAGQAAADDAVQEAFVKAFRAMKGKPPREFRTWLLAIARNASRDQLRKRSRYSEVLDEAGDDPNWSVVGAPECPEQRVIWAQRVARLRRVLDERVGNPNQRDAFLMRLNTKLDDEAIGRVLGVSAKAVRSYVCQTRKLLHAALCEA